jgi:hypothetical protein
MANVVSSVIGFLRVGYPAGMPATGYVPLVALLPRRVSDDEIAAITEHIMDRGGSTDAADVGMEISRVTDQMPSLDDIDRVQDRLAAIGGSAGHDG